MTVKKTPAAAGGNSGLLNEDADDAFELTLYEELVAFTTSPDEEIAEEIVSSEPLAANIVDEDDPLAEVSESVELAGFEAVEEAARPTIISPAEPIDDSFQVVPGPTPRGATGDLDRELTELFKASGPLDLAKIRVRGSAPLTTCRDCGAPSTPDDMFCLMCGALLGESELSVETLAVCAECGAATTPDEVFCASCGAVLPE